MRSCTDSHRASLYFLSVGRERARRTGWAAEPDDMRVLEEEHRAVSLNQLTDWLSWLTAPIGPGSSAIYFSGFSHRMKFSEVDN
jgi:hypothetical protein